NSNGSLFFEASDATHGSELHVVASDISPPPIPFGIHLRVEQDHKVKHTINEGDTLRFITKVDGDVATKFEWFWQDGTGTHGGDTRDHLFRNNLPNDAPRMVRLKVTTAKHGAKNVYTEVTVLNVAPSFTSIRLPAEWVTYLPVFFSVVTK